MAYESEEEVREALDKLRELTADKALMDLLYRERLYERDQMDREAAAIERGKKENLKDIVRKMLKENMKIEIIMQITELTKEEIEKIKLEG